jgi:hypothetical protein
VNHDIPVIAAFQVKEEQQLVPGALWHFANGLLFVEVGS